MNVRILERLGFDWLARAEEIAALTTIQTEFPQLAVDIERHPALLPALTANSEPANAAVLAVYREYRPSATFKAAPGDHGPDLDLLEEDEVPIGKELDSIVDVGADEKLRKRTVSARLAANLDRYLRKLVEMRCPLPRADLILMHAGGRLVSFDDPEVYNALLLAGEAPQADTLTVLEQASDDDKRRAITYLAEELEGETFDLAQRWMALAGEIAESLDHFDSATTATMLALWDRCLSEGSELVSQLSAPSYRGFARVMAGSFNSEVVEIFLNSVEEHATDELSDVLEILVEQTPDADFGKAAQSLSTRTIRDVLSAPATLRRLIHRADTRTDVDVSGRIVSDLSQQLIIAGPAEAQPVAATAAARAAAEEANESARAKFELDVGSAEAAMREVVSGWDDLRPASPYRSAILYALRETGSAHSWPLDLHDELLKRDQTLGRLETLNNATLEAIAQQPRHAASRWRAFLDESAPASPSHANAAFRTVFERALSVNNPQSRSNAVGNAVTISRFVVTDGSDLSDLTGALVEDATEWKEFDSNRLADLRDLIEVAVAIWPHVSELETAIVALYIGCLLEAANDDEYADVIERLKEEAPETLAAVADALIEEINPSEPADGDLPKLAALLTAQAGSQGRSSTKPIAWASLTSVVPDPSVELTSEWLMTGPGAAELKVMSSTVSLSAIPRAAWTQYSNATTPEQRAATWRELRGLGLDRSSLTRIASNGVPDHLYGEQIESVSGVSTISGRLELVREFITLPRGVAYTRAAVDGAERLASSGKAGDAPAAAMLLLSAAGQLNSRQRTAIRARMEPWLRGAKTLTKADLKELESHNLLKASKGIIERIFR